MLFTSHLVRIVSLFMCAVRRQGPDPQTIRWASTSRDRPCVPEGEVGPWCEERVTHEKQKPREWGRGRARNRRSGGRGNTTSCWFSKMFNIKKLLEILTLPTTVIVVIPFHTLQLINIKYKNKINITKKYNIVGQGNFWKYLQIRHCVKNKFNASDNPVYAYLELPCKTQTASMCYKLMLNVTADTCNNLKTIWQKDLGINIHDNDWLDILSNVGKNIREARGKFIHYKIVHRYYYTPSRLYRMGIAGNSLCWKCKKEEGTYLHMIWECSLVQPFWRKILRIFEEWLGFNLPVKPQLCLLGDKSVVPNIAKNDFTLIKIGCIRAARMILRNWKCPKTPDLKDWIDGMIEISSYECMLGRLQSEGNMKKTWDLFWHHIKMVWWAGLLNNWIMSMCLSFVLLHWCWWWLVAEHVIDWKVEHWILWWCI